MKEATGELSVTVIAVVAIAAIAAIFTAFLLPTLRAQIALSQACSGGAAYSVSYSGYKISCGKAAGTVGNKSWTCTYSISGGSKQTKTCYES